MQMNYFFKPIRTGIIGGCAALAAAYVIFCYGRIAFMPEEELIPVPPTVERGSIVDRNGRPLAVQTSFYHFGVTPSAVKDPAAFAADVAPLLGMQEDELSSKITRAANSRFIYLKKKIDQATYTELQKLIHEKYRGNGVRFDKIPGRAYPENSLASQIIGYMGDDGVGLSGAEYSMQSILSPVPKAGAAAEIHGENVYLTIDANLQYKLEKTARAAMERTQAASLMLIAAEAKTGEILSYISLPSADLNNYSTADREQTKDRPAMEAYEPGSVFKIFTVATLLETGGITPQDTFVCDGLYEKKSPGGETIRIKCLEHHGTVTAREALKYSCNDALAQISDRIDAESFLARIRALGFGSRTGIELPGETTGSVKTTDDRLWSDRSKPTISIGQEISVSALQMVHAATALANGGIPVKLTILQKLTKYDGTEVYNHEPVYENRLFRQDTAEFVLSCMETTAESGTGSRANLRDISIGVKTGTAQMADHVHGGYSDTDFLSNCLAIFPVENPEIILYIVVEKARGETYAGRIVAPVIAEAADIIIDHMGFNRGSAASLSHTGHFSIQGSSPVVIGTELPDFTGMSKRDLLPLLNRSDLHIQITGNGWVTSQNPQPGTPVTEHMTIELTLE